MNRRSFIADMPDSNEELKWMRARLGFLVTTYRDVPHIHFYDWLYSVSVERRRKAASRFSTSPNLL